MKHPQVALGEVADLMRGITYKPSDVCDEITPSAVACMRTKNVQEVLDESDIVWIPASIIRNSSKYLQTGDILVSSANSWNLVGKGCWVPELRYPASAGGFISILRGDEAVVDLRYLYHWFTSPQTQAKLRSYSNKTTNISNLDHSRTLGTEIPLPPLEEQRRIAANLDKAASLSKQVNDALARIMQLEKSVFEAYFGSHALEHQWETGPLSAFCSLITDGEHQTPERAPSGVKLLSARNIRDGRVDLQKVDFVPLHEYERISKRCAPKCGDVLISCSGSIGRVSMYDSDEPIALVRSVALARPLQDKLRPLFLEFLLRTPKLQALMKRAANASSQANLFQGPIKSLQVFAPPLERQDAFIAKIAGLNRIRAFYRQRIYRLHELSASIANDSFAGALT
jgi:type I restriction enzyme S subunit